MGFQEIVERGLAALRADRKPQHQVVAITTPLTPQQGQAEHQDRNQRSENQHPRQLVAQAPAGGRR